MRRANMPSTWASARSYVSIQRWPQRLAEWLEDRGLTKPAH